MASKIVSGLKSVFNYASGTSQDHPDGSSVDDMPLVLDAPKVNADFRKHIRAGSLGTLYPGKHLGKNCIVKVYNRGVIQKEALRKRDIGSIIQLHPNVVLVHGLWYGSSANALPDNQPALVMEMCSISLDAYLKERADKGEIAVFRLEKRLDILTCVASGMIYLHSKGIVHGELCAKKVLLNFTGPSNDRKITAKVGGVDEMKLFNPVTVKQLKAEVQRNNIMPPEVKAGGEDMELTDPVDVFSFGCLVAHVATCVYPVPNTKANTTEFQRRAHFITGNHHRHVYEPLMKRCLDEHPPVRGTFEDVKKDLSVHLSKYGAKQAQKLEEVLRELETRRADIVALEKETDKLKKQIENLQKDRTELQLAKKAVEKERDSLDQRRFQLEHDKKTLEDQLKNAKEESLRSRIQDAEKTKASFGDFLDKYEEAQKENRKLEQELARQRTDMERKDAEVLSAVQQHSESVTKHEQLWRENKDLKEKTAQLSWDLKQTQKSLDDVSKMNDTLSRQKQQAEQWCGQLQHDLEGLGKQKLDLDQALADKTTTIKVLNGSVQDLTSKGSTKTTTINRLTQEVQSLKEQLKTTRAQKEQAESNLMTVTQTNAQTKKALENCRGHLDKEKSSCQALQGTLKMKQDALEVVERNLGTKEEELLKLHEEKMRLQREAKDQASSLSNLEVKLKKLQEEIDQLKDHCQHVEGELDDTKAAKDSLERSKQKLEDEKSASEIQFHRLQGKLDGKGEDLSKKEKEYTDLLKRYQETQAKCDEGQELLPAKDERIHELEDEKQTLEEELKKITMQRDTSRKKVEDLADKVQELEAELQKKKDTISKLQSEERKTHVRISTLEDDLTAAVSAKEKCTAMLEAESSRALKAERSLDAQKEESLRLEREKQGLLFQSQKNKWLEKLDKAKELQIDLQRDNDLLERDKAELAQNLHKEQDEKQQILKKLGESTVEVESIQRELASTTFKLKDTETSAKDAKMSLEKCNCELKAMTKEFNAQQKKLQEMQRKVSSIYEEKCASEDAQLMVLAREEKLQLQLAETQKIAVTVPGLKEEIEEAKKDLAALKTDNKVLLKALEQKATKSLDIEETNSRLKASLGGQKKARQQKQQLQRLQTELQREKLEVHSEKAKLQEMQEVNEQMKRHLEQLMHTIEQEREKLLHGVAPLFASCTMLKTVLSSADHSTEYTAQLEGRIVDVEQTLQMLSDATKQFGAALQEVQSSSHDVKSYVPGLGAMQRSQGILPLRFRTGTECTGDEAILQQLCCMATGIKQLIIGSDGGKFTLGSGDALQANGDASLEFPPGAVATDTPVRFAIILHGPFVFPAGYKPGSVVVYLNMDGATLLQPVRLLLNHWYNGQEQDEDGTLKFFVATHSLESGKKKYEFEEVEADYTIHTHMGVLTIRKSQCLYCIQKPESTETIARYSAITFTQYIPSEDKLLFRIQLMCDSEEWIQKLKCVLRQYAWEVASNVTQFRYADGQQQITASPDKSSGPGWNAVIDGTHAVKENRFLAPTEAANDEVEQDIIDGRFPPCILYKIYYISPGEKRTKRGVIVVDLNGADVPMSFSCGIQEEMMATFPVPRVPSEPDDAAMPLVPAKTAPFDTRDILVSLDHKLDAKWQHFGTFLNVDYNVMEAIQRNKGGNPEDCMLELVSKWTSNQPGMGTLPRRWKTVVDAVWRVGDRSLAETLARKFGEQ